MARGWIIPIVSKRTGKTTYQVRMYLGIDPATGKRIQPTENFPTREAAERRYHEWMTEVAKGTAISPDKRKVRELLTEWLAVKKPQIKPKSYESYADIVERILIPGIGEYRLQKLTPAHVQTFFGKLEAEGKGARTRQMAFMRLRQALDYAVRLEYVSRNVTKNIERPKVTQEERTIWTPEQAGTVLAKAGDWQPLFAFILATGVRRGEALGLRWQDVDLDRGTARIVQTATILKRGNVIVQSPKTDSGRRTIKLGADTVAMLSVHKESQTERQRSGGFVFPNLRGGALHPSNVHRAYARIIKEAGVPYISLHEMRHSHASWLLLNREPPQVVSERLGHANPAITMRIYAHTLKSSQEESAALADGLLYRNPGGKAKTVDSIVHSRRQRRSAAPRTAKKSA